MDRERLITRNMLVQTALTSVLFAVFSWLGQPMLGGGDRSWAGAMGSAVLFAPAFVGILAYVRRGQLQDERAVRERQQQNDSEPSGSGRRRPRGTARRAPRSRP